MSAGARRALLLLSIALCVSSAVAQVNELKRYTECKLAYPFSVVQVDGPREDFDWPTPTKAGNTPVHVESGYRVLVAYMQTEGFGNLKVERLPATQYSKEKADLLSSLDNLATQSGMNGKVDRRQLHGYALYGANRATLQGGVLSVYNLFDDADRVAVTMYLLNAEPSLRKFSTVEQYDSIRDAFLESYTSCLKRTLSTPQPNQ